MAHADALTGSFADYAGKAMSIQLHAEAWLVVDASGYTSLHREQALAMNYLSHVRGGIVRSLCDIEAANAALDELRRQHSLEIEALKLRFFTGGGET